MASMLCRCPASAGAEWLAREHADSALHTASNGRTLMARRLGAVGMGESMWLLTWLAPTAQGQAMPSRLTTAALTPRETEVLSWIAKGKTNRDVGEILGMSPAR